MNENTIRKLFAAFPFKVRRLNIVVQPQSEMPPTISSITFATLSRDGSGENSWKLGELADDKVEANYCDHPTIFVGDKWLTANP